MAVETMAGFQEEGSLRKQSQLLSEAPGPGASPTPEGHQEALLS